MNQELSIRDLIELIIKRKWLVCITTIIAILLSGIYSFFILKPSYNASVTLLVKPIEDKKSSMSDINGMIDSLTVYPNMTIDTYKEQVINNVVLSGTIKDLQLKNPDGELIQWSSLAGKISVDKIGNTNLLKVTVSDGDPQKAAKIANSIADNFISYISNNTRKFGEQAMLIIEERLGEEENKLKEEALKLKEYLSNSNNIEQLKMEVKSLLDIINNYNLMLIDVEKQIQTDSKALEDLLNGNTAYVANNQDEIMYNIPLDNNEESNDVDIIISSASDLKTALLTIKTSEIESRLIENKAEKASLENKIEELLARLNDTQAILAEEEYKYNTILRNYNLAEQTYNAYLDRHKEAVVAATSSIGEYAIIVSSPATIPVHPSNHGKLFYLIIGAAAGIFAGMFFALIVGYWKATEPKKE